MHISSDPAVRLRQGQSSVHDLLRDVGSGQQLASKTQATVSSVHAGRNRQQLPSWMNVNSSRARPHPVQTIKEPNRSALEEWGLVVGQASLWGPEGLPTGWQCPNLLPPEFDGQMRARHLNHHQCLGCSLLNVIGLGTMTSTPPMLCCRCGLRAGPARFQQ